MTGPAPDTKGQPGITQAALFALCPRCGAKGLFASLTLFAPKCPKCDLDYERFNVGDGPAAFLTMIVGALVVGLALGVETAFEPPMWVHLVLWAPLILGATLWGLRVSKAALLAVEFKRKAGEATGKDIRSDPSTSSGQLDD
jgi:uncharacterized protein (DUF983 family)